MVDVIVIGAGLTGSAAAWALSRHGRSVLVLEARTPGHADGSSHGSSRIFRTVLDTPRAVDLALRARLLWDELADESGAPVLRVTGGLDYGPARDLDGLRALAQQAGVPTGMLSAGEAQERWPQLVFDTRVLHSPDAGVVDLARAMAAFLGGAARRRAEVRYGTPVEAIEERADAVVVSTPAGTWRAASVVLAAGPWLPGLWERVGGGALDLRITEQHVAHFEQRDPGAAWPVVVRKGTDAIYALPSGDDVAAPAMKVGGHDAGPLFEPGTAHAPITAERRGVLSDFVRRFAPGLESEPVREDACIYTSTPDDTFVLDTRGRITVASPCSGQGAKFMPAIGEAVAELALGGRQTAPEFTLGAHLR